MNRESALAQLREIRQEILAIHKKTEACTAIQSRLESLQKERDNPTPPKVSLKPENTAVTMKQEFERQNRLRIINSRKPEIIARLASALLLVLSCVLLACDLFGNGNIILRQEIIAQMNETGSSNVTMFMGAHILMVIAGIVLPLVAEPLSCEDTKWNVLVYGFTIFTALYYTAITALTQSWLYLAMIAGSVVLMFVAFAVIARVRKQAVKSVRLTGTQIMQLEDAKRADERTAANNVNLRNEAQKQWEADRQLRLPEIRREMDENINRFNTIRGEIDRHMQRLSEMDALCEEDKSLQVVDILIRFIETRRADSVKEALQEYDKLVSNQQLMEIEKQKLAAELKRTEVEHADRMQKLEAERRHQSEMEYLAWDNAQSRKQAVDQLNSIRIALYNDLHY